ncbi:MAG: hypothetical protein R3A48_12515 [Polyangiales bacterium]
MSRSVHFISCALLASLALTACEGTTAPADAAASADAQPVADAADVTDSVALVDAPAVDAAAEDVARVDVSPDVVDAAAPQDAGVGCALTRALVTTSDFSAGGYALGTLGETPSLMAAGAMAPDQDHAPVQSGCVVYNLLRGNDIVAVLDPLALPSIARQIPLRGQVADAGAGPYQVNPYDVLTLSPTKAYVVLYALAHIAVVNPTLSGPAAITGRIDLSPVRDPLDADPSGAPEAHRLLRVGDRALLTLQNLSAFAPVSRGTIAVLDLATDQLVDLAPSVAGVQGVSLSASNPQGMTLTPSGRRVVISSSGVQAFSPPQVLDGAIEAIDAMTLQPAGMRVTEVAFGGDLSEHVMLTDDVGWALVTRLGSDGGAGDARVMEFDLSTGAVGRTLHTAQSLSGIARAPDGSVWVLDRSSGAQGVRVFSPDGAPRGGLLATALPPTGIAFVP